MQTDIEHTAEIQRGSLMTSVSLHEVSPQFLNLPDGLQGYE